MEVIEVRKPTPSQKALLETQPTWSHDVGTWEAEYDERCESFLVVSGKGAIQLADGRRFPFAAGDFVTCQPHTKCVWSVEEFITKHYIFDMEF